MADLRAWSITGALHVIGAYYDGCLVGFCNLLCSLNPHYSTIIARPPSRCPLAQPIAVRAPAWRCCAKSRSHRERARRGRAAGECPAGGTLAAVLEVKKSYRETNRVFFRGLQP